MHDLFKVANFEFNHENEHKIHEFLKLTYQIINSSTDVIIVCEAEPTHLPGPRIVYVNKTFEKETGYTSEEVIGKTPRILQGPKTDAAACARMRESFKKWQPIREDVLNYKKSGEEFWISLNIFPIANETGWFTHWIAIQHNITERKNREEKLLLAKAELLTAFKVLNIQNEEKAKRAAELAIAQKVWQDTLMEAVEVILNLGKLRDPYTTSHEKRVAEIAVAISAELGFDSDRQHGMRVVSYLHDVGNIHIPEKILFKPGKLTDIEYSLVKSHSQTSYDALKHVAFPWPVAEVAFQHHERFDGTGYPRGLKGEEIIMEARILSVVDVVEAMSSHRPYRSGLGIDRALDEIKRGRGITYDATVVDACLKLFNEKGYQLPC